MKRARLVALPVLLLALVAGAYLYTGRPFAKGEVFTYLDAIVNDLGKGDYAAACNRVAEDARFDLKDAVSQPPRFAGGGKSDLCGEFTLQAIAYTDGLVKDSFYKTDLQVHRDPLHWRRASVTYDEHHEVQKYQVPAPIKSVHHVSIILEDGPNGLLIKDWRESVDTP